jgi:hypothetical protein
MKLTTALLFAALALAAVAHARRVDLNSDGGDVVRLCFCSTGFSVLLLCPKLKSVIVDLQEEVKKVGEGHRDNDREMKLEVHSDEVEIETKKVTDTSGTKTAFKMVINTHEDTPRLRIRRKVNNTEFDFRVEFFRVFTYVPTGGAVTGAGYQSETITSELDLSAATFSAIACSDATGTLSTGVLSCLISTVDGAFQVKVQVGTTDFVKNGITVAPSDIKIQVVLNYPAAVDAVVALELRTRSKNRFKPEEDRSKTVVTFGTSAYFSWEPTFTDDLVSATDSFNVVSTSLTVVHDGDEADEDAETETHTVFAFEKLGVQSVNWDPVLGSGTPTSSSSSSALSTGAIAGIAAGASAFALIVIIVVVVVVRTKNASRASHP